MGTVLVKTLNAADASGGTILEGVDSTDGDDDFIDLQSPACVKNIHIDGISKTQNLLVTRQLERIFDAGNFENVLHEAHLGKLKLERLGIFAGIEVFLDVSRDDGAKPGDVDVYYYVKECRRLSANAGTNVGNNEGNMTFGGKVNNLRGLGEAIKLDASFGTRVSSSYGLSVSKPLFYDPDKKFTLRGLKSVSDFQQSCYRETSRGVSAEITLPTLLGLHSLGWEGMWRENNVAASSVPFEIREHSGHTLKSSIKHTLISDGRNDWIFPSNGHYFRNSIEFAGLGGNVNFLRADAELNLNVEVFKDIVLAGSIQSGIARALNRPSLMINDRYFLGGPLSVRGFGMKGIGQHAEVAALGGEVFWASGLHLYTPLPFRPGKGGFGDLFRMHFFANAGNLSDLNSVRNKDFLINCRWSYGAGIMFMLGGMARLEINYCIPKNAQPGDIISEGLQVGVGLSFL